MTNIHNTERKPNDNISDVIARQEFNDLLAHVGHDVEIVAYGKEPYGKEPFANVANVANVAIECMDCFTVIYDRDNPDYHA